MSSSLSGGNSLGSRSLEIRMRRPVDLEVEVRPAAGHELLENRVDVDHPLFSTLRMRRSPALRPTRSTSSISWRWNSLLPDLFTSSITPSTFSWWTTGTASRERVSKPSALAKAAAWRGSCATSLTGSVRASCAQDARTLPVSGVAHDPRHAAAFAHALGLETRPLLAGPVVRQEKLLGALAPAAKSRSNGFERQ